jgi:hypothetical protein
MPRFYFYFSLLLSLFASKVYAQTSKPISIVWEQKENNIKRDTLRPNLSFVGAYYDLGESKSPIFKRKIRLPENISTVHVTLDILDSIPFSSCEIALRQPMLMSDSMKWKITYERKTPFLTLSYIPLTSTHKVLEFQYHLDLRYSEYEISSSKTIIQNSVLSDGDWYRFKVTEDGLYKIDKAAFEEMGISIGSINPTKIQVYGNGGAMLPEFNGDFRFDDLEENAVFVYGEDDGTFNSNDFVVFYAQSPHRWEYDSAALAFSHQLNIYDNTNYYYIHIGAEDGKRIGSVNTAQNSNFEVDFHTHPTFYEWEDQNLKHTGRQWFGEYFSFNEQYNINFSFVDRIKSNPVRINARAVARSTSTTNLSCKLNGTEVLSVPIGVNISSEVYVDEGKAFSEFITNQNSIGLSVSYDKNGNSAAFAYLDYIELQAKCALNYNGGQLLFKEPSTIGLNRVSKFVINSNLNSFVVWDLTNPTEVTNISLSSYQSFSVPTETLKTFAIHDLNKSTYKKPLFDKKLQNQNLHGQATAELLIITAPEFLEAAERLAEYHINEDAMTVNVATTEQIYNEFSSGKQDIIALRDYVKMFYNRALSEEEIPENVLLFGDASFDYKGITAANGLYDDVNFVPTFQSKYSFKIGPSYCTDDFIAFLDTIEGAYNTMSSDGMDIGVGRIVCQTLTEAQGVVDKIINYNSVNSLGDWRSNICFVADDVDDESWEFRLQENIDAIASRIDTSYANYNINKVYLDSYQQIASSGGQRYPDARQAIVDQINKGTLMMHYYGHGGEVGWAEERVLELIDINTWENMNNLAVFITATCEFSRYDDAKRVSAGEQILLNPNGAGIALFTTTRTITESDAKNLSTTFYKYAIPESAGEKLSFGSIMRAMKNDLNSSGISATNKMKFTLLGDPSLKFPIPENKVVLTEIIDAITLQPIDTVKALSRVIVKGQVTDANNAILSSFNGLLQSTVYDKPSQLQTINNDFEFLDPFYFYLQQNILYAGNVSVNNGLFEFEFVVPKDISYAFGFGKISLYAHDSISDAIGADASVLIGGFNENASQDDFGPEIQLFINNASFREGGITNSNPNLFAMVTDESGINTTGNGIGHDIVAILDEDSQDAIVLNHYYESNLDSYQTGTVSYPFSGLSEGVHSLKIKVWDVHNNSSEDFTEFLVVSDAGLILSNLMNYPNPFNDFTRIHFEHNQAGVDLDVRLDIYDFNGRKVKTISNSISSSSYSNSEFVWDGSTDGGMSMHTGVYICKLTAVNAISNEESTISTQMVLIK